MDDVREGQSAQVERLIKSICFLLYSVLFGGLYVLVMALPTITSGLMIHYSTSAPDMWWRYDPFLELRFDHSLLVLDEPAIFGSYRLNDLFSKFNNDVLVKIQTRWFMETIKEFKTYLDLWMPEDFERCDPVSKRVLVTLTEYIQEAPKNPETFADAINRMKEWMEAHPIPEQDAKQK
jgi:hypothetical protein